MAQQDKNYIPPYLTPAQAAIINQDVPDSLVFSIDGHDYVNHSYITSVLNKVFNFAWQWIIIDKGIEEVKPFKSKAGETPPKSYYAWVLGELSYPVTNPVTGEVLWVKKQAFGGKMVVGNAKVQSQDFKSASSDAFKKASSLVGIAKNIYMKKEVYNITTSEESDPDSWVPWKCEVYSEEIKEMKKLKESISEAEYQAAVEKFCRETENYTTFGQITPSNICDFLDYVNKYGTALAQPAPAAKPKITGF